MINPIDQRGVTSIEDSFPVVKAQPVPVPRGLAAFPDTIDQAKAPTELTPCLDSFFQKICDCLISIINTLKRFFCLSRKEEITTVLNSFDNSEINGKINGIYITTNETGLENTYAFLARQPKRDQPTIHIGCAAWYNLDIIYARKSTYGLIVDFNPKNGEFIKKTVDLINSCESREAFKSSMIEYLHSLKGEERGLFFHPDQLGLPTDRIEEELSRKGSWLETEESYQYIKRELVSKNRLIAITEDIRNSEKFSQIRQFLDTNGIAIDTVYESNICNFMYRVTDKDSFVKSLKHLLDSSSIFIHCPKIKRSDDTYILLNQRAVLGEEVLADSYDVSKFFEEVQ